MSLKNQIEEKLNKALKEKDKKIYPTLRLIVSAIKDTEIANRTKEKKEISDSDIMSILSQPECSDLKIIYHIKQYMILHLDTWIGLGNNIYLGLM